MCGTNPSENYIDFSALTPEIIVIKSRFHVPDLVFHGPPPFVVLLRRGRVYDFLPLEERTRES